MMKKKYTRPAIQIVVLQQNGQLMDGMSSVTGEGFRYGGSDESFDGDAR